MRKNYQIPDPSFLKDFFKSLSTEELTLMKENPECCNEPKGFSDSEKWKMDKLNEIHKKIYELISEKLLYVHDDLGFPVFKEFIHCYLPEEPLDITMGRIVDIYSEQELNSRK